MITAVIANMLIIVFHGKWISETLFPVNVTENLEAGPTSESAPPSANDVPPAAPLPETINALDQPPEMGRLNYSADYDLWYNYRGPNDCDPRPWAGGITYINDNDNSVDTNIARYALGRNRDRDAIEGYITKDSSYYKYHYAEELINEEAKPWWGRDEF